MRHANVGISPVANRLCAQDHVRRLVPSCNARQGFVGSEGESPRTPIQLTREQLATHEIPQRPRHVGGQRALHNPKSAELRVEHGRIDLAKRVHNVSVKVSGMSINRPKNVDLRLTVSSPLRAEHATNCGLADDGNPGDAGPFPGCDCSITTPKARHRDASLARQQGRPTLAGKSPPRVLNP